MVIGHCSSIVHQKNHVKLLFVCIMVCMIAASEKPKCDGCYKPSDIKSRIGKLQFCPSCTDQFGLHGDDVGEKNKNDPWTCSACTYLNVNNQNICEMCNTKKGIFQKK